MLLMSPQKMKKEEACGTEDDPARLVAIPLGRHRLSDEEGRRYPGVDHRQLNDAYCLRSPG